MLAQIKSSGLEGAISAILLTEKLLFAAKSVQKNTTAYSVLHDGKKSIKVWALPVLQVI